MVDQPFPEFTSATEIPVRGDCGHVFTAPVARIEDGEEFTCPVCGAVDRFDEEDRKHAHEQLAKLHEQNQSDPFLKGVGEYLRNEGGDETV